jgi:enoyl-CoA hydratase/carnithine racemase
MPPSRVESEVEGSLAVISIESRATSDFFNEAVLAGLTEMLARLTANPLVKSICVQGGTQNFLVGADIHFFQAAQREQQVGRILDFTRSARTLLDTFTQTTQTTATWVRGSALGAGLELALSTERIVASPNAKFSMPETGLGIYPGMGGTQRLARRIGPGLAKWMIYTGAIVPAEHALAIGLVDALHRDATTAREALTALEAPPPSIDRARFAVLEDFFGEQRVASLLDQSFPMPGDPQVVRALIQMRRKAPLALALAEQIIDRGLTMPLSEGLDLEFAHLAEIFATEDARVGLASVGGPAPQFAGR